MQIIKADKEFSEIQTYKVKTIIEFLEYMHDFLSNPIKIKEMSKNQKKNIEFNRKIVNFGIYLLMFASDSTIKKYNEWRDYGKKESLDKNKQLLF